MKTNVFTFLMIIAVGFLFACNTKAGSEKLDDKCFLEPEAGMCKAAIPKFHYDKTTKKCKQFSWGGCGGVVPFETLAECQQACKCEE